jgi:hypothetical protein
MAISFFMRRWSRMAAFSGPMSLAGRAGAMGGDAGSPGSTGAKRVVHDEVWRAHTMGTRCREGLARRCRRGCYREGLRGEVWYPEAGAIGEKSRSPALAQCHCGLGLGPSKVWGHDAVAARSPASRRETTCERTPCSGEQEDAGVASIMYQKHIHSNGKARWLDV